MRTPQPGIFAQGTRAHYHLEFDVRPDCDTATIARRVAALREPAVTSGGTNLVVGFGAALWRRLAPHEVPNELPVFQGMAGPGGAAPATPHDLWIWIHGTGHDVELDVARAVLAVLAPAFVLAAEVPCFVYRDGRDLTGFVDGTENPPVEAAPQACILPPDSAGAGGSYAFAQKWQHDLGGFHALPVPEQERVIGRTKADSVELDDEAKPANAHIARTVIEDEAGDEIEIYRRSVPWGTVSAMGLFFLAFTTQPAVVETMLGRMLGLADDGVHDRLLDFSRALTGAWYFVPALEELRDLG